MPCGSNSCRMYLEPHGPLFESSGRKYNELYCCIQILTIPAADFIGQTATSSSAQLQRAAWSEFISTVCWMTVYSAPSWQTAIVWNQPEKYGKDVLITSNQMSKTVLSFRCIGHKFSTHEEKLQWLQPPLCLQGGCMNSRDNELLRDSDKDDIFLNCKYCIWILQVKLTFFIRFYFIHFSRLN